MPMLLLCITFTVILCIDAAITGEPLIKCGTNSVVVKIPLDQPFKGHLFIRGHFGNEMCHKDYRKASKNHIDVNFPFDNCGMHRRRQTNPRGLSIRSTLILSFHPTFVTYNDKAFNIECFYKEDNHVVHSDFEVSPLQATEMVMQPPMPICKYSVLKDGPSGTSVASLTLGEFAYHKWDCESEKDNKGYCMRLHSCTADDGEGTIQQIVDQHGCSVDEDIFPQIQYTSDTTAGVLAKAFKFADRSSIFFQCQIGLGLKVNYEDGNCMHPNCSVRRRRSTYVTEDVYDLFTQQISISDITINGLGTKTEHISGAATRATRTSLSLPRKTFVTATVICILFAVLLSLFLTHFVRWKDTK